jgi:outer membrane protein assembly factor BamB
MNRPREEVRPPMRHSVILILLLSFCRAITCTAAVVFAPPDDSVDAANELKGIDRELADGNYGGAAKRLDTLLAGRSDPLVNLSEGGLISVSAWVDRLAPARRKALAVAWEKAAGATARQTLESLRKNPAARPDELYALWRRYPLAQAAGAALAEGGDRALQLGDLAGGRAFYELAARAEFSLGEARSKRLEALEKVDAGAPLPRPADLAQTPTAGGRSDRPSITGPLPFDAAWFGNASLVGQAKFFPAVYDERIVLASWNNVTMLRESGQVLWESRNPRAAPYFATDRTAGRGSLFAPAALCDVYGRPLIIVVRQPIGEGQFVLRGLGAADGKAIWSTENTETRKDLSYAGLPTVAGKYVYSIAIQKTGVSSGSLVLCATDVTNGQSTWQTPLGSLAEQGDQRFGGKFGRNQPMAFEAFAELSDPAVDGNLVIVSPNCGSVMAVDRFDGRIRWVGVYRETEVAGGRRLMTRPGRWLGREEGERSLLYRYKSTPVVCGNVVLAMPQDAPALLAFDRISGKSLWETDIAVADTYGLAGASGNMAVLCGGAVVAGVDAGGTGKLKWRFAPPRGAALTGPAVVVGQTVIAPSVSGFTQLNVLDGTEKSVYSVPSFRRLLSSDAGRNAISEAGASRAFGVPPGAR